MASYALPADLAIYGLNPAVFANIIDATKQTQLDAASTLAEGYLADQYHLPIVAPYPVDLKMHVCSIAAFFLMSFKGYRPDGSDVLIRQRYDDALTWLRNIATGMVTPAGIIDSTPQTREGAPAVVSGLTGNVVGGYGAPTVQTAGPKPFPGTGTIPGRRGW